MLKSKKWVITTRLVFILLLALVIFFNPKTVFASTCDDFKLQYTKDFPNNVSCANIPQNAKVSVTAKGTSKFIPGGNYSLLRFNQSSLQSETIATAVAQNNDTVVFTITNPAVAFIEGRWKLFILGLGLGSAGQGCGLTDLGYDYSVSGREWTAGVYATQTRDTNMCYGFPTGCLEAGTPITLIVENVKLCGKPYANKQISIWTGISSESRSTDANGNLSGAPITFTYSGAGNNTFSIVPLQYPLDTILKSNLNISAPGYCDTCLTTKPKPIDPNQPYQYKICDQINGDLMTPEGGSAKDACLQCVGGNELGREGIWTAIGCIPRDPEKIVKSLLRLGLGMGGGFALIIILASGFVLSVSQGEPNRINEAKQWLTSALVGLLFIIFSVTLLHFIGYTIFRIPGFGGP